MEMILQLLGKRLELFIAIASLDLVVIVKNKYWFVIFFTLFYFSVEGRFYCFSSR